MKSATDVAFYKNYFKTNYFCKSGNKFMLCKPNMAFGIVLGKQLIIIYLFHQIRIFECLTSQWCSLEPF